MQNNEVKATLISLGDEPDVSMARGMRNEEEKRIKGERHSRTNKAMAGWLVSAGLASDTSLKL